MELFETAAVPPPADSEAVVATLQQIRRYRLPIGQELELHRQLERVLAELLPGEEVQRERSLTAADRIDFYLPRVQVGIEVKVKGQVRDIALQLERYASSPQIAHLVLVTGRLRLMPIFGNDRTLKGKPFTTIALGGQLL